MKNVALRAAAFCAVAFAAVLACLMPAAAAQPIRLVVDVSQAPSQNIVRTHETIPVRPGPLTLYYPKWIPGEHQPVGPIVNVADLTIRADGRTIPWRRNPLDMFAFETDVPKGVRSIDVHFTYLGATFGRYSSSRLATPNMLVITWNQNLLYPSTGTIQDTIFAPSIVLPGENWKYATALYDPRRDGNTVTFARTSLEHLVDSPLDSCVNFRQWVLWHGGGTDPGTVTLNACADVPSELDAKPATIDHFKALVREMLAMYGARHWHDYHFLLTLSDVIPGEGVEHHESSDDGEGGNYLIDPKALERGGDLLSHEFNHSWDGKYRMPAGLYPKNLQLPYDDSLLWVYEGMTQYYGDVMSFRDGIRKAKDWPDQIASFWAHYDNEPGRKWRSLGDTATSGPFIYQAPFGYGAERRGEDFYTEAALMWLRADSIIRARSHGTKSLDTFARAFFGQRNTGPIVVTYDRADVIAGLNAVVPYDWAGFFHKWIDDIAIHPPDGFTADGWKLVYTEKPSHWVKKNDFWYSLGFSAVHGSVGDVRFGSPAWKASLGIDTKLVAVDGRAYSDGLLYDALKEAHTSHAPIVLLVEHGNAYRTISIAYGGGPRYPHLQRIPGKPDVLDEVIKPRRKM